MIKTEEFRAKALVLFSGGLDSILTAELLRRAGVDVTAITFESPFFGSARAKASASAMLIPIEIAPVEETEYMNIVKSPSHGRGRNMNPCIDCHGYMLKIAAQMMASLGFDFIATGEVLGERPMSQNRDALDIVAKMSGIPELVLRPLSAKLLPKTLPETMRWVLPENLLAIQGRSRAMQFSLADQWGLKEYPNPSGGCLLTDPGIPSV